MKYSRLAIAISYILVGVVALLLRVHDLGGFLTVDEATTWVPNSYRFLRVLQSGNYEATPFMGHPAITTMWLGSAGVVLRRLLFEWGILTVETYPLVLALNRLPIVLTTVAGLLLSYGLLRRLFPAAVALLAAVLWATDPFIIAFSRVIHMDVLMGTFATLSLLTTCWYWNVSRRPVWLALSGICAGLAVLSKLPAMVLFPVVAVVAFTGLTNPHETESRLVRRFGPVVIRLLMWGAVVGITVVALWPTFWTNPIRAYEALRYGIAVEGGSPHLMGNFFLGEMNPAPGPIFYPVALAMRTTPWSLIGLFLLPIVLWPRREGLSSPPSPAGSREQGDEGKATMTHTDTVSQDLPSKATPDSRLLRRNVAILAGWCIVFIAAMSVFPLKFNRYLVPIFPVVNILAAVGLAESFRLLALRVAQWGERGRPVQPVLHGLVILMALANAIWYHPYSIVYFNQMLGGAEAGAQTFLIGWGEGIDQVADYLNEQPDITSVVTISRMSLVLNPYLRKQAQAYKADGDKLRSGAGYLLVYARHMQWGQLSPPYRDFFGRAVPLHTVNLHGVDYAWVYQVPQKMAHPVEADFGPSLSLHGYELETADLHASGTLTLTMQWHTDAPLPEDYALFVHVLNEQGERVGQLDVPLLDVHAPYSEQPVPTSEWQPGRYVFWTHPVPVQRDTLNEGRQLWLAVGVYRPDDFSRLPIGTVDHLSPPPSAPDAGADALLLEPVRGRYYN